MTVATGARRAVSATLGFGRRRRFGLVELCSRGLSFGAALALIGLLPWISVRDPAMTILRERYGDRAPTPEVVESVRAELGLDESPIASLGGWFVGVLRGDWGTSWAREESVLSLVAPALGVSLLLACAAFLVAALVALGVLVPALAQHAKRASPRGATGVLGLLAALPSFLYAVLLMLVGAVWLGWFPPYGWGTFLAGVLPALALGVPTGAFFAGLGLHTLSTAAREPWVATWTLGGISRSRIAGALAQRSLPTLLPQAGITLVALVGGSAAVEVVFAVPGLGRLLVTSVRGQDVPVLQGAVLAVFLVAVAVGAVSRGLGRRAFRRASTSSSASVAVRGVAARGWKSWSVPAAAGGLLIAVVGVGFPRDPVASAHERLAPPSLALPLGADALGRDVLARLAHGTVETIAIALGVVFVCLCVGVLASWLGPFAVGPMDVAVALRPIVVGALLATVLGPSAWGAAVAVAAVMWVPFAQHASSTFAQIRARSYWQLLPFLGVRPLQLAVRYTVPAAVPGLLQHAFLRLPAVALALTSLAFLGLGPQQPSSDWGLLIAAGLPYAETAPWVMLPPVAATLLLALVAAYFGRNAPGARLAGAL
ncbi:ABC transporter permease [Pseudoclavibacter sp. RFBJ3]|uniref:ABC transporter permease subunit n=1 Tax=unclassified Pseudoclavibacter TaxID=2615177 RepID=UPI000CE7F014|nr:MULTISPECIES: ABC transporter permease subunit [unclassified Pseudoclavibacter]PPF87540.1 ABC transporter permease [Pseudoclavibacter sp. RFBJ5]PPF90390.1 ABC transporter permease [Pseudoclavibacter sp. RFBJ3]PPG01075.1 ABC transporter permease [Pseudoclavibacter sp. RFBH5]PPG26178.1 ABC transporter permease [Pseudoclavibacter sp. RFBI4]